jgi:hypothetical protein
MTIRKMQEKSAEWLEERCLHMCHRSILLRHLKRVKIEPTKPPGTGPNWQVAGFEPELRTGSPAYNEAMDIIYRIRGSYALGRPAT